MNIEKRLMQYYRCWNIEFPYEEQFLKFKHRIITIVDESVGNFLVDNSNLDKNFLELIKLHRADEPTVKTARIKLPNQLADSLKDL